MTNNMNIFKELAIVPNQPKPPVLSLRKSDKVAVLSIGLAAGQVMPEHQTQTDASLVMLQGKVHFRTVDSSHTLVAGDWYEIPPGVPHDVLAEVPSAFLLIREN